MITTVGPMTGTLRISILFILEVLLTLRCIGIRIRGYGRDSSITYDPDNPITFSLVCEQDDGSIIDDSHWTLDGQRLNIGGGGRLILDSNVIGTDNPQSFEGMYRCETTNAMSDPLAIYGKTIDTRCCLGEELSSTKL